MGFGPNKSSSESAFDAKYTDDANSKGFANTALTSHVYCGASFSLFVP